MLLFYCDRCFVKQLFKKRMKKKIAFTFSHFGNFRYRNLPAIG
ncbi:MULTISPECIES: zinc-finger domain-containing protein [Enterococcus]